jgi:ppGpp synthetase/RelA/SpoT-type nucleotidyltranferase
MAEHRTTEDALREEYFDLLSDIRRTLLETETRVRSALLAISLNLRRYERLIVTSRAKECDSAIDALRRRQPLALFDPEKAEEYSLTQLRDLAAVRVMVFPQERLEETQGTLQAALTGWSADPIPGISETDPPLAFKYYGKWIYDARITAEVQIVPLLVGLFWEVEHSAIYKPSPNLRGVVRSEAVLARRNDVLVALRSFENEFESAIRESESTNEEP